MIPETPSLQRGLQPEGRFVTLIKNEFIKHAKEINKLERQIFDKEDSIDGIGNIHVIRKNSSYEFPNIGKINCIYVDMTNNKIYMWDENNMHYYCIGTNYEDIKTIEGGNA